MKKAMTILYKVHDNLYVNLTNKCPCACTFCLRQTRDHMEASDPLWLEHEPTLDEVIAAFQKLDMSQYRELVFCGFGEPTERLDLLLETAAFAKKEYQIPTRINTNGLGDLIQREKLQTSTANPAASGIAASMKGLIDTVSISLNTPNEEKYNALVRSKFGDSSFQAMLDFAADARNYIPNVVMTTVATTLTPEEEQKCQHICDTLGVTYRIRPWEA